MNSNDKHFQYTEITSKCFINAPFDQLYKGELLKLFINNRLQPEIGLEGDCLWQEDEKKFHDLADTLQQNSLQCTLHAPFFDLVPGGFDQRIVEITREKLQRAFQLLKIFKPASIVCHLGFEENKHRGKLDKWLATSLETWKPLLDIAGQAETRVMFENTYEVSPEVHLLLFEKLKSSHLGFCMDTGHLSAFAHTCWQPWLAQIGSRLGQLHLHDNNGQADTHIALGLGSFNFKDLFAFLHQQPSLPLITLEPHTEADLWKSLAFIQRNSLF